MSADIPAKHRNLKKQDNMQLIHGTFLAREYILAKKRILKCMEIAAKQRNFGKEIIKQTPILSQQDGSASLHL